MTNRDHSPSISQNDGGDAKLRTEGSGLDLDVLEAVARAATPGPWRAATDASVKSYEPGHWGVTGPCLSRRRAANAAHIATFDPPTCLAMIQTQRELVAALKAVSLAYTMAHEAYGIDLAGSESLQLAWATIVKATATPPPPSAEPGEGGSIQTLEETES